MTAFLNVLTWLKFITGVWIYFCEIRIKLLSFIQNIFGLFMV